MKIFSPGTGVFLRLLTIAALALCAPAASAQERTLLQGGTLECDGQGGWGAIIASHKEFQCVFKSMKGQAVGRYQGVIQKIGIDIGVTGPTAIRWAVLGPATRVGGNFVPGSLAGEYAGVGGEATAGVGLGANALIGGGVNSLALQPLSVQAQSGLNIAAGVQTLILTYIGPAQ